MSLSWNYLQGLGRMHKDRTCGSRGHVFCLFIYFLPYRFSLRLGPMDSLRASQNLSIWICFWCVSVCQESSPVHQGSEHQGPKGLDKPDEEDNPDGRGPGCALRAVESSQRDWCGNWRLFPPLPRWHSCVRPGWWHWGSEGIFCLTCHHWLWFWFIPPFFPAFAYTYLEVHGEDVMCAYVVK